MSSSKGSYELKNGPGSNVSANGRPAMAPASSKIPWAWIIVGLVVVLLLCTIGGLLVYFLTPRTVDCTTSPSVSRTNFTKSELLTKEELMLPKALEPLTYSLTIQPYFQLDNADDLHFTGSVEILVRCIESTQMVVLNSKAIEFSAADVLIADTASQTSARRYNATALEVTFDVRAEKVSIQSNFTLEKGKQYIVNIRKFTGLVEQNGKGFYLSRYKKNDENRYLAATQFEVANARQAFPCFDEPRFKANFTITIVRRKNMRSLSNMDQVRFVDRGDGWVEDYFATSVKMSTYLVAFAVCDFQYRSITSNGGVKIRAFARADAILEVDHALDKAKKILDYFTEYFDINYSINKLDLIALPDFSHGAMENWGLVTFKETSMLYDEKRDPRYRKQTVAMIVGHEIAHQWFGNLVTMFWWTDLWLNEGFAHYMGFRSAEEVDREEEMEDFYVYENVLNALKADALENTHPVVTEVYDPVEILQLFDHITYRKGSCLIRMMASFLGPIAFRDGLRVYLKSHQYSNAVSNDLWLALDKAVSTNTFAQNRMGGYKIGEVMDNWIKQSGFPLVTVIRNYDNGIVQVSQQRFYMNEHSASAQKWLIPFTYTDGKEIKFNNASLQWIHQDPITLRGTFDNGKWFIGNALYNGFYRVNYDTRNWVLLTEQLKVQHRVFPNIQRAQILDDSFDIARAGQLDLAIHLNLTQYLDRERDYVPWAAALSNFRFIDDIMQTDEHYSLFQQHMKDLLRPTYDFVTWNRKAGDGKYIIYLRQQILTQACYYGDRNCLDTAKGLYDKFMRTGSDTHIPVTLRPAVSCFGIQEGGEAEWDFAWQLYLNLSSSDQKMLLGSLACTRVPYLLTRLLNNALNQTLVRRWNMQDIVAGLSINPAGRRAGWNFIKEHWALLVDRLDEIAGKLADILSFFTTRTELDEIDVFINSHDLQWTRRRFLEARETVAMNVAFKEKNLQRIVQWLKQSNHKS